MLQAVATPQTLPSTELIALATTRLPIDLCQTIWSQEGRQTLQIEALKVWLALVATTYGLIAFYPLTTSHHTCVAIKALKTNGSRQAPARMGFHRVATGPKIEYRLTLVYPSSLLLRTSDVHQALVFMRMFSQDCLTLREGWHVTGPNLSIIFQLSVGLALKWAQAKATDLVLIIEGTGQTITKHKIEVTLGTLGSPKLTITPRFCLGYRQLGQKMVRKVVAQLVQYLIDCMDDQGLELRLPGVNQRIARHLKKLLMFHLKRLIWADSSHRRVEARRPLTTLWKICKTFEHWIRRMIQ